MNNFTRPFLAVTAAVGFVAAIASCDPPTHPKNYTQTIIHNLCRFQYSCCTPTERAVVGAFSQAPDEAACNEELSDTISGFMAVAAEAVDRGTATYDAEAADRCTADRRAAIDSCDSQGLAGPQGLSFSAIVFLVDERDAECLALANRGFTRGTVKAGDDCLSSIECADFGSCEGDEEEEDEFAVGGKCKSLTGEGDSCADEGFNGCQPGLSCNADGECAKPELGDDGDVCTDDSECKGGFCTASQGSCAVGGDVCDFDDECPDACTDGFCSEGNTCTEDFDCFGSLCVFPEGECKTPKVTIEICDGL